VIAGGRIGYNYQWGGNWVSGIEMEGGYLHLRGSASFAVTAGANVGAGEMIATSEQGDWCVAITGRLGYAWNNALLYFKGGGAVIDQKVSVVDTTVSGPNPGLLNATGSKTKWGAALGGGAEWAFAPNWSVKAEYLYLGVNSTIVACGLNTGAGSAGFGATFCSNVSVPAIHTAKVGVNYLFH
jgi:outer membrane immunogenic protein